MNSKSSELSILEQVLEQPMGNKDEVELLPFGESQTFYMEREIDLKFQFMPDKVRCGSQSNNDVKLKIRIASGTRDSLGFVFDNAVLSKLQTALNNATMTTSCEELCIFAATMVKDNSRTPLKWISVAAITDFPSMISFTWKEREEMPSVKLIKSQIENKRVEYKIERQNDASPLLRGCGR